MHTLERILPHVHNECVGHRKVQKIKSISRRTAAQYLDNFVLCVFDFVAGFKKIIKSLETPPLMERKLN